MEKESNMDTGFFFFFCENWTFLYYFYLFVAPMQGESDLKEQIALLFAHYSRETTEDQGSLKRYVQSKPVVFSQICMQSS